MVVDVLAPLKKAYSLWMRFSHILGRVVSCILLTVLWIVVFGVYAIALKIMRLFASKTKTDTYWIDVSRETTDSRYQF